VRNVAVINLFNGTGGGVRIALHIVEILAEKGYRVRFIALSGFPINKLDKMHGTNLIRYLGRNLSVKYFLNYSHAKYLLRFRHYIYKYYIKMIKDVINTYNPDVIILFDDIPKLKWDSIKARVILYSHFPYAARILCNIYDALDADRVKLFDIVKERFFRKFTFYKYFFIGNLRNLGSEIEVVANSTITSMFVKKVWNVDSKILFPFISTPQAITSKEALSTRSRPNVIVSLGVIAPGKRYSVLIDAFSILKQRMRNSKLVILGSLVDKNYYKYLHKKIKRLGLENDIFIITNVSEEKKWDILLKAKIYVHAKRFEPFGIAVAEAMYARAVPIVYKGFTSGPWIDIVEQGRYGFGFRTVDELADVMDQVLSYGKDELEEWGLKVRERAKRFSLEVFKQKFMDLLNKV